MIELCPPVERKPEPDYKYDEGLILEELKAYVDATYSEHYHTDNDDISCFDAWVAKGSALTTCRDTAMKYLWRYGEKDGANKKDLLKALHYTMFMLWLGHYKDAGR